MKNSMEHKELYRNYIKRLFDILLSSLALLVLSPILLLLALVVQLNLGSPVVFKQPRPGMNEKIFYLYKFRSMTNDSGEDGRLLPDSQRITKFGKFLRSTSLDELPELVNIIRGDMSIVGPRPLSIYYLPHYPDNLRRRHSVRPGLTGLAQISGRNNLLWDDRFSCDIEYVDNLSFVLDVKIILRTVLKVLKRSDVLVRGTTRVKDYGPYGILKEEINGGKKESDMTYSEIGSYFWLNDKENNSFAHKIDWLPSVEDYTFAFSGRNAIDIALRDILKAKKINRVFVPSYCCVSMLQSFIDRGLKIEFYEVEHIGGAFVYRLPRADSHSIVLIMSYFGLSTIEAHKAVESLKESGVTVIEDVTHSLLCTSPASEKSDYLVASLRKWFAVPTGGWVGKKKGSLSEKPGIDSNHAVEEKIIGMKKKYDYLTGKINSKEEFLLAQAKFDNDLIHVDRMLKIDDVSMKIISGIDVNSVISRRRENVSVLLNGLSDLNDKVMKIPAVDLARDTPLFLPVFMETHDRENLRKFLISKGIYCPVHWPEVMGASLGVRANELSLICDQRYSKGDMRAISEAIHDWHQQRGQRDEFEG